MQYCFPSGEANRGDTDTQSRDMYKKLAPILVTKIVQFDWSAVLPETCTE